MMRIVRRRMIFITMRMRMVVTTMMMRTIKLRTVTRKMRTEADMMKMVTTMTRMVTAMMMRMVTTMRTLTIMMMLLLPVLVAVQSRGISGQLQFLFTNCDPARPLLVNITRQPLKFNLIFDRERALDLLALASKAIAVKANKQSESLSSMSPVDNQL